MSDCSFRDSNVSCSRLVCAKSKEIPPIAPIGIIAAIRIDMGKVNFCFVISFVWIFGLTKNIMPIPIKQNAIAV